MNADHINLAHSALSSLADSAGSTPTLIAQFLLEDLVNDVREYANMASAKMVGIIAVGASALLGIYVLLWGAGIAAGTIQEPFVDGAKRILRMCAIIAFALTIGIYQGTISDFLFDAPPAIAKEIAFKDANAGYAPDSIAKVLDAAMAEGMKVGYIAWDLGREVGGTFVVGGIGYFILAILIWISVACVVAIAAGLVVVAYLSLALMIAVGPLFILFALFPATQRFFEAWLGQVLSFAILFILVAVCVGFCFHLFNELVKELALRTWQESVLNTIKTVGACVAMVAVMLQTRSIAAHLSQGVALQGQGLAGKLGGFATGSARMAVNANSKRPLEMKDEKGKPLSTPATLKAVGSLAIKPAQALARRIANRSNSVKGS